MNSVLSSQLPIGDEASDAFVAQSLPSASRRTAIYFDSGGNRLFGWFHAPREGMTANMGLLICKPCGYEGVCSHRSLRTFEDSAVALGLPTLSFDYLGTGDSADIDPQADQLAEWTRNVIAGIQALREQSGVRHVCLLGLRLGALIAVLAADECDAVTSLILISPIIRGRKYLSTLRTTRLAAALSPGAGVGDDGGLGAGSMEVSGFLFSAATQAALAQIDLGTRPTPAARDILIIDGDSLPGAAAWSRQLVESGVRADYLALPGLIEMIMTAPQYAAVPREMVAATRDWLTRIVKDSPELVSVRKRPSQAAPGSSELTLRRGTTDKPVVLTERPVFFGNEIKLFGIVTEPRQDEIRRRAVILLNAGADYHIGANGMHVAFARDWAEHGYVALRMDLAGIGDSDTRAGMAENEVFPPAALDDIRAAVEFLRGRYGVGDITLFGLCSGAYHALRSAVAGLPINGILMVNPQNYYWNEQTTLSDLQLAEVVHNPGLYRRRLFSRMAWKRLFGGEVDIWRIAKIYFYRPLLELESTLRNVGRRMHVRVPNDLGWDLEQICKRGVKVAFVFAKGEPGIDLLHLQAGSAVGRLGEDCRIHIIDSGDHIFSQYGPRTLMKKIVSDELFSKS
jgi:alpha-beta hydrolase superfamily lysophospholipase